jgi:hypothetical protein
MAPHRSRRHARTRTTGQHQAIELLRIGAAADPQRESARHPRDLPAGRNSARS